MIIHDFFYILKITVDIHATKGNKGERTLKIFKLLNHYQSLQVSVIYVTMNRPLSILLA